MYWCLYRHIFDINIYHIYIYIYAYLIDVYYRTLRNTEFFSDFTICEDLSSEIKKLHIIKSSTEREYLSL